MSCFSWLSKEQKFFLFFKPWLSKEIKRSVHVHAGSHEHPVTATAEAPHSLVHPVRPPRLSLWRSCLYRLRGEATTQATQHTGDEREKQRPCILKEGTQVETKAKWKVNLWSKQRDHAFQKEDSFKRPYENSWPWVLMCFYSQVGQVMGSLENGGSLGFWACLWFPSPPPTPRCSSSPKLQSSRGWQH